MNYSTADIDIATRTVWGEARGEGAQGQTAVAWVIRNRVENPGWWGSNPSEVCQKPWQFSCWNNNDPNRQYLIELPISDTLYKSIREVVVGVFSGSVSDPTNGADFYKVCSCEASWSIGKVPTVTIGRQDFYHLGHEG